jgi:hypothetical protein
MSNIDLTLYSRKDFFSEIDIHFARFITKIRFMV